MNSRGKRVLRIVQKLFEWNFQRGLPPIELRDAQVGVLIFLLVFFIPRFQLVFAGFNAELPLITQIIVKTSELVRGYGLFLTAGIIVAIISLRTWLQSPKGRRAWEGMLLRLPQIGPLIAQFAMARFCRFFT